MKVALITQHYPPYFEGGTEIAVRAQAKALAARGIEVLVVAGTDAPHEGTDVEHHEVDGLPVAILRRHPDEFYDLLLKRERLRSCIEELVSDADLVHLHHWSTLDRELVRTLATRRPVVVTLHDLFVTCPRFFREPQHGVAACPAPEVFTTCVDCVAPDVPTIPRPSIHEGFRQRFGHFRDELAAAAHVLAPSHSHLERVRVHVPIDAPTRIVPHGLAAPFERSRAALRYDGSTALRIGFLGNRAHIKGVGDLARALASLPAEARERVELLCFGEEVEDGLDAALTSLAKGVRITFCGRYEITALREAVEAQGGLHVVCLPSRAFESYGLVVDEAHALGLPVWVSDRGAPKERIGGAGRVLPAEDPATWAQALSSVLDDPSTLERERGSVPEHVRTAADAAADLIELYGELLETAS